MKFRSMILVLTIAFSAIFVSMLGTSYAYYVSTDGTSIDVTTGNIDTGAAVIFEESEYININNAIPGRTYSSNFIISPNTELLDGKEHIMSVGLTDIYIDDELKIEDLTIWTECVYQTGEFNAFNKLVFEKNGTNFTPEVIENDYILLGQIIGSIPYSGGFDCAISVELKETEENQNHLMNKKFRGLIKVNTLFK